MRRTPVLLVAAVYVPLRRTLDEVAWEVRVKSAVQRVMGEGGTRVVESRVRVERHQVDRIPPRNVAWSV